MQPKRCLLGKTMNYYSLLYQGKYDELVHEAYSVLDTNKDAERAFLRMFMELDTVYLFKPETVAFIETEARKGNRHMQYAYARYLFGLRPTEQAIHEVFDLLSAAAQQGLADAKAVLADMYGYGDIDIVDYNKEETLMHEAFDEGSEMAAMYILRNYCYGQHFHAPRPDLASEMADDLIARDEQAGIEPNGIWYYYRGVANEHYESKTRLVANYLRAAELGVRRAYGEILIAYGYGDSATLHQTPDYNLWMEKGIDHRACSAYFLAALGEMMKTSEIMRDEDALFSMLTQAAKMGHAGATELEGDMFLEGSYQWKQDYKRAAESYYRAIDNGSAGAAGAAAVSVLTEPEYFKGSDSYVTEISRNISLPIIRKDFTVDEYMIYQARLMGASAVLLICSILDTDVIARYISICDKLGLSALVETHNEDEVKSAIQAGAHLIGVNNRDLKDFTVDIGNCIRLRELVPEEITFVAESGIKTPEDIQSLREAKVNAVLIGETLMRAQDKKRMLDELRGRSL